MPSSYTGSLRFEQQFTGENINVWGVLLNAALARIDDAIAGVETIALTGNHTLTTANGTDDEARHGILKFTGTGSFTVTIPSVSKLYVIWNGCTGTVTVSTGGGATVILVSGEIALVLCDGSNVKRVASQDMGGARINNVGQPSAATDAATKKYVDDTAFATTSGQLPGQIGASGQVLSTDGSVAGWTDTLPYLRLSTSDGSNALLVNGSSKGLRVVPGSNAIVLEGADNTGSGYQPLVLGGSSVLMSIDGGTAQPVATEAFAIAAALTL